MNNLEQLYNELEILSNQSHPPVDKCKSLMTQLKIGIMKLNSEQSDMKTTFFSREVLEVCSIASIKIQDEGLFERNISMLRPYYSIKGLQASVRQHSIMGLYLMFLLAKGRIHDFHTEMEQMEDLENRYVKFPIELERDVIEGRFSKVWSAKKDAPNDQYLFFFESLLLTIRKDIGACLQSSYQSLSQEEAAKLLFFSSNDGDFLKFVEANQGWKLSGNSVLFPSTSSSKNVVNAQPMIDQTLLYAHELERII